MSDQPSEQPGLRLERDGDIGFIIASNPARMNAFTAAMWEAVPRLIAAAEADDGVRVIVLRGCRHTGVFGRRRHLRVRQRAFRRLDGLL
ncbi:MAG: hypothetical protein WDN31_20390 [Hyphomicrobium sp.]